MEAQEHNKKINCPACQAVNPADSKTCRVCGNALNAPDLTNSETSIDQDLGKANLLRMRGNYKEAHDLCLSILRKAPNNVTAHSLLGDIAYEQDDLKHAAEWYELASDLDPNATREKQLLERIRQRLQESEHLQTLEQLGVETKAPAVNRYIYGGIVLILIVSVLGYVIGNSVRANQGTQANNNSRPITIPPTQDPMEEPEVTEPTNVPPSPALTGPITDQSALAILKQAPRGNLIISCVDLPDRGELVVTARTNPEENVSVTALLIASDVFVNKTDTRVATIRLVQDERVVFSGEVTREAYDEAQALSAQGQPDLQSLAAQAFPTAYINDGQSNVIPRSDQDATQSSGSAQDQYSGSPPESP